MCVCVFVYFLVLIFYTLGSALTHLPRPLVAFACPKDLYLPERSKKNTLVGSAFVHTFPFFLSHYTGRQVAITKSVHWRSTGWIARKLLVHFSSPTRNFFALHFRSGASARAHAKKKKVKIFAFQSVVPVTFQSLVGPLVIHLYAFFFLLLCFVVAVLRFLFCT